MKQGPALENLADAIVETCRAGLDPAGLRHEVLGRLRRAVPFDAAFWATVDPTTLLFTQLYREEISAETVPFFIHNEFLDDDVNKWTALTADPVGVRTLAEATCGNMDASPRHREIFRPMGLGDELRAVLRVRGVTWGCVCLHRSAGTGFSRDEVMFVRRLAPHLAEGIRACLLISSVELSDATHAPGLVVIASDGSVITKTAGGEHWLEELGQTDAERHGVPAAMHALVARLRQANTTEADLPRLRVRTRAGRWAVLHASRLPGYDGDAVAVIIEEPSPAELAPILMLAYGLTNQEQALTQLVCRGLSTRELGDRLHITNNTVQDHLKSIFEKTGVRSRRELVTAILQDQYLPRVMAGESIASSGFFRGHVDQTREPPVAH